MINEAVILAGGFGTRLSHVLGNVPKPMAPVAGKPFLTYLLTRLQEAGFRRVVLATGYRHEVIADYFGDHYGDLQICYSQEQEPLFTGGAIALAAEKILCEDFVVLNGDTLFAVDFHKLCRWHEQQHSPLTLALRQVDDTARYGAVEMTGGTIRAFREKEHSSGSGLINGGIYVINKHWLQQQQMPRCYSFEKELLQVLAPEGAFRGMAFSDYFIDIGIPEDYYRAQREFPTLFAADKDLFLDRDGVLNRQIVGDYVRCWQQWEWIPGALDAMARFNHQYRHIFLVSNQQGVGKGVMTEADLTDIHTHMLRDIEQAGGRIDAIYCCTDLKESRSDRRKPAIGMALDARRDFPEVDFNHAVMVGDSLSDMQFGYRAGMRCIYLTNGNPIPEQVKDYTDLLLNNLEETHTQV